MLDIIFLISAAVGTIALAWVYYLGTEGATVGYVVYLHAAAMVYLVIAVGRGTLKGGVSLIQRFQERKNPTIRMRLVQSMWDQSDGGLTLLAQEYSDARSVVERLKYEDNVKPSRAVLVGISNRALAVHAIQMERTYAEMGGRNPSIIKAMKAAAS